MNMLSLSRKTLLGAMLAASAIALAMPAMAAQTPVHVRGIVESVTASGFTVQTATGTQTVALAADTRITGVVPSSLAAIKAGTFIGTANVEHGKSARALEVVVFPDAMKGTGLGDYAWDLSGKHSSGSGSAMTNGTVKMTAGGTAAPSAMTNGTVQTASGEGELKLVVDYGKGQKVIHVPSDVPVVTFKPADKSAIVKGAHVFVAGAPGTPVNAALVAVGLDGTVPPM
jgi:hypothetical protein